MKTLLLLASLFLAVTARGNLMISDTLAANGTYNPTAEYHVIGAAGPNSNEWETATRFTAAASGVLASIDLGLTFLTPGLVHVFLYGNAGSSPDNAAQTFLGSVTPTVPFGTSDHSLASFAVVGNVAVTMGTNYWLVLKPGDLNGYATWNESTTTRGGAMFSLAGLPWTSFHQPINGPPLPSPAYRISVLSAASTVPDSSNTLLLSLSSFSALLLLHRMLGSGSGAHCG